MSFDKLTPNQKIQAVNIDCMRHNQFALISGHICAGKSEARADIPTACTNGVDKYYGTDFISSDFNRKQLRYLVAHENLHVALKHCVLKDYHAYVKRFGNRVCNMAMDYVVNGIIEEMDPEFKFVERPTKVAPLVDPRFTGMSFPQVLRVLIEEGKDKEQPQDGEGPMDDHEMSEDMTDEEREAIEKIVDDANRQGELMVRKMRGEGAGGRDLLGTMQDRQTNWREALTDFITEVCKGDENSRFCPPNKRLLASGFIMPSHFDETVGEIIIATDTSGSMHPYYPIIFGEVARVCQNVKPQRVRVLWWDTEVGGDQEFLPEDYERMAELLKPVGGGGTTVSCVAQYIKEKEYKPMAVIMLTDGYIESQYNLPDVPVLWGVVENDSFVPLRGKVMRIQA